MPLLNCSLSESKKSHDSVPKREKNKENIKKRQKERKKNKKTSLNCSEKVGQLAYDKFVNENMWEGSKQPF